MRQPSPFVHGNGMLQINHWKSERDRKFPVLFSDSLDFISLEIIPLSMSIRT